VAAVGWPDEPLVATVPLTGGTWTQGPEELNQIIGQATVTTPTNADCGFPEARGVPVATFNVFLDGRMVASERVFAEESMQTTQTIPIRWPGNAASLTEWVYEQGKATSHTLTVQLAADNCGREGTPAADFTMDSVSIDVIGVR
jgi:hypothetical protein